MTRVRTRVVRRSRRRRRRRASRAPLAVGRRHDLRRLDFAAASPEDVGVQHWDPALREMCVDRRLVREHHRLLRPVRDAHDVHVPEVGTTLPPVGVRHDVVPANLASRIELPPRRHAPVEEGVVARHPRSRRRWLHVLEERREPAHHTTLRERSRHADELVERQPRFLRPGSPRVVSDLIDGELPLERLEHPPLEWRELGNLGVDYLPRRLRAAPRLHAAPPHVPHAQREELLRRHGTIRLRTDQPQQQLAVLRDREALWYLERRPEPVRRARRLRVGGTDDDVSRERVIPRHEVKGGIQTLRSQLPCDQRAGREIVRHERLPDATDGPRGQHGADALEHHR